jgi:hypothetical protein
VAALEHIVTAQGLRSLGEFSLKGQSHEKFGEMGIWGFSLGQNFENNFNFEKSQELKGRSEKFKNL